MPCSNAAKTRNPLKFAGVPQTTGSISAASGPKFTILWGHVDDILLLNKLFSIVDSCLSCEDIARQSCAMVPIWRLRLGEERKKERKRRKKNIEITGQKYNGLPYYIGRP